ncbi:hypothetical protein Droror1_Dr00010057 [Drosera rotundifolia]
MESFELEKRSFNLLRVLHFSWSVVFVVSVFSMCMIMFLLNHGGVHCASPFELSSECLSCNVMCSTVGIISKGFACLVDGHFRGPIGFGQIDGGRLIIPGKKRSGSGLKAGSKKIALSR